MDEFLNDEFFMKLIRLGVAAPELRPHLKKVAERLDEERKKVPQKPRAGD